jgi:hypothetical protein
MEANNVSRTVLQTVLDTKRHPLRIFKAYHLAGANTIHPQPPTAPSYSASYRYSPVEENREHTQKQKAQHAPANASSGQ